ncbi:MAG: PH domain-containing protein [Acidobacteria bacterium]|nr:PH domain-containing protein [Acidobacteriota bacterium]
MFCDRCGAENKDTASFCRTCGQAFEGTEVETRVVSRPPAYVAPAVGAPIGHKDAGEEATIFSIRPTLLFVKAEYLLAAIGAVLLVGMIAWLTPIPIVFAIILGLLLFLVPAYFHLRQKLVGYRLTQTTLEIDSGLIATTKRNIPLRRIQDVTVSATVFQRLAGLGDVVIDNASEEGGKTALRNIDKPRIYADMLLKQMAKLDK